MIQTRVIAGLTLEELEEEDWFRNRDKYENRIRVQADEGGGFWRTMAIYPLEDRPRAIECAKQIEQFPKLPLLWHSDAACVLYATAVQPAVTP